MTKRYKDQASLAYPSGPATHRVPVYGYTNPLLFLNSNGRLGVHFLVEFQARVWFKS